MKRFLIWGLLGLFSCGSNDISGIYTITDYYYEENNYATPQQLQEETSIDRPDVLGTQLYLHKYDNSLIFKAHSGETSIAKEITDIDFIYTDNSSYLAKPKGKIELELSISRKKIIVKETVFANLFSQSGLEKTIIVFILTKN